MTWTCAPRRTWPRRRTTPARPHRCASPPSPSAPPAPRRARMGRGVIEAADGSRRSRHIRAIPQDAEAAACDAGGAVHVGTTSVRGVAEAISKVSSGPSGGGRGEKQRERASRPKGAMAGARCYSRRHVPNDRDSPITDSDSPCTRRPTRGVRRRAAQRPERVRRWSTRRASHHENRTRTTRRRPAHTDWRPGTTRRSNQTVAFPRARDQPVAQVQSQHDAVAKIDPSAGRSARPRRPSSELERGPSLVEGIRVSFSRRA